MKKIISILLSLIMLLGSVNVVLAGEASITPSSVFCAQNTKNVLTANAIQARIDERSFIVFDLAEYIPDIYLGGNASLSFKSGASSANMNNSFVVSIVPKENMDLIKKAVADLNSVTSIEVKQLAALQPDEGIYTSTMGWSTTHPVKNVETSIKSFIETNGETMIAFMFSSDVSATSAYASFLSNSPELVISSEDSSVSDAAYYSLITSEFNFDNEANVSSDAIADDFTLPSFYKGSNITWTSDNAAISITGNNAAVTRQLEDTNVKLTATFSYKDGSSYDKDYIVTVAKKHILDVIADEFNSSYALTSEPLTAVTTDVNLASSYMGAALTWTSSDNNVVHPITGKVVPSTVADTSVTLTPTVSSDGEYRNLNPINITVKKYDGKVKTLAASDVATVKATPSDTANDQTDDSILYSRSGSYSDTGVLWNRLVSYVMFDISDVKDTIANSQGSVHLNLTSQRWYSDEVRSDAECYNIYIVENNDWNSELSYNQAMAKGMTSYCENAVDNCNDPNAVYCSPKGQTVYNKKYTTTDILPAIKAYIANNPDAEKITFMIYTPNNVAQLRFYGTNGTADQNPSLEIRYNFETPSFEAVKNTDGTYSAVIKTNDAIDGSYNVYFAAYSADNALVGIDVIPDVSIKSGATRINADAQKFVTQGASKIKCIITKADGITPLWKNDELKLD